MKSAIDPVVPLLESLSLREKIGQTCQIHGKEIGKLRGAALLDFFEINPVGSIFLGSEIISKEETAASDLRQFIVECQEASKIPLSIAGDLENGAGGAIAGLTAFPQLLALSAVDDLSAAYEYGKLTALEACKIGFNWTFGPVVDLSLNWLNPIVSIRSLGDSPERVAALAGALIRGCQDNGLSATAKHFPGDGVDFRDQHLCVSVNSLSEETWWETYGGVYEACFQNGVHAVMAGHIALPWIEPRIGTGLCPLPATTSARIMTKLLRERMGYEGVVVSDALIMAGFRGMGTSHEHLIIEAFNAGIDVMLWPGDGYVELMERAIERGDITMDRLDRSVRRVLAMKEKQQQFAPRENRNQPTRNEMVPPEINSVQPEERAVAFANEIAERSLTIVENRSGILPLDPEKVRRVQVLLATPVESNAQKRMAPLLEGFRARGIAVDLHVNGNCLDLRNKEQAGERFDVLIAIFELWTHGLKNTMRPTGPMAECIWTIQGLESMSPIVVSLGSPYLIYDMPWSDTCVNAYSNAPATLRAVEKALFGEIPFQGKSPVVLDVSWTKPDGLRLSGSRESSRDDSNLSQQTARSISTAVNPPDHNPYLDPLLTSE